MGQINYYNLYNFTTYGSLGISQKVLEDITRFTLSEMKEIVIPDEKKKLSFRKRSIRCDIVVTTNEVFIYLNLGIKYGHNVTDVCQEVQDRVENALLAMADLRPKKIFIEVVDIK
jgi:uncharacterized alkaline shock family protein YloU